jgi:lipoate-protein ligase A
MPAANRPGYNSDMPAIRLLPSAPADGPTNMAADESLLETAAEAGTASLRFYTWTEPTLSLGYFQPAGVVRSLPEPLPWVRRATGGAAILHHRELTYALALPAEKEWHSPEVVGSLREPVNWVCRLHHLLRDVLADFGVKAHAVLCGEEKKLGEVLCFLHQTPGDLLIGGSKVAGSAQRKRKGALLQHGSLLISRSEFAPRLPGINDADGRGLFTPAALADLLADRFRLVTGWEIVPGDWTDEEASRTAALVAERYAADEWNAKR